METPKTSEQSASPSDEIDLIALIEILWNRKWFIALVTGLAVIAGYGFHKVLNRSVTASLSISQLNPAEISSFDALNKLELVNELNPSNLLELYYGYLSSYDNAKSLFLSRKLNNENLEGEELRQAVMRYASYAIKTSIKRPRRMIDTFMPSIQIEIRNNNKDELKPMLDSLVSWASDQTKDTLALQFAAAIENKEKQREYEIERVHTKIEGLTEKYYAEKQDQIEGLNNRIATLREIYAERKADQIVQLQEQAEIARSLGIAKPVEANYDILPDNAVITQFSTAGQPLYLSGYLALDNQVKLQLARKNDDNFIPGLRDTQQELLSITSRKDDEAYVPNLRTLEENIFLLKSDPFIDHAKDTVEKLLHQNKELRFVRVDLNGVSTRRLPGIKILMFAGAAGIVTGIIIVFLLAAIRYRKSLSTPS